MYRHNDLKQKEKEKERRERKGDWYKKGDFESVIIIPATPKSKLKTSYMRKKYKIAGLISR